MQCVTVTFVKEVTQKKNEDWKEMGQFENRYFNVFWINLKLKRKIAKEEEKKLQSCFGKLVFLEF